MVEGVGENLVAAALVDARILPVLQEGKAGGAVAERELIQMEPPVEELPVPGALYIVPRVGLKGVNRPVPPARLPGEAEAGEQVLRAAVHELLVRREGDNPAREIAVVYVGEGLRRGAQPAEKAVLPLRRHHGPVPAVALFKRRVHEREELRAVGAGPGAGRAEVVRERAAEDLLVAVFGVGEPPLEERLRGRVRQALPHGVHGPLVKIHGITSAHTRFLD